MTATAAFLAGLRRARVHWRLVVPLYAANLLVAALCAVAVHGVVSSAFGSSQAPQAFLEGFDLTTTADMLREQGEGTGAVLTQLPWMLLLSIFLSTFLAGGVLSTISAGGTFSARVFLHG